MKSTIQLNGTTHQGAARPHPQPMRTQPVRLPQATADLVNRMLATRCGGVR